MANELTLDEKAIALNSSFENLKNSSLDLTKQSQGLAKNLLGVANSAKILQKNEIETTIQREKLNKQGIDVSTDATINLLDDFAKDITKLSSKEAKQRQKIFNDQLATLRRTKSKGDPIVQEVERTLNGINKAIKARNPLIEKAADFVSENIVDATSLVAGLTENNPLALLATKVIGDKVKGFIEERNVRKQKLAEIQRTLALSTRQEADLAEEKRISEEELELTEEQKDVVEDIRDMVENSINENGNLEDVLSESQEGLVKAVKGNALQMTENSREQSRNDEKKNKTLIEALRNGFDKLKTNQDENFSLGSLFLSAIGLAAGALIGVPVAIANFIKELKNSVAKFGEILIKVGKELIKLGTEIFSKFKNSKLFNIFERLLESFKKTKIGIQIEKAILSIEEFSATFKTFINKPFIKLKEVFKKFKLPEFNFPEFKLPKFEKPKFITKIINFFSETIKAVKVIFLPFTTAFEGALKLIGKVGSVLGKIFLPFVFILGAFETIKGIIEGFKMGGLIGGIQGGIEALFNFLVVDFVDFIGKIFDFIGLESLGKVFESIAGGLKDGFSALISGIISTINLILNPSEFISLIRESISSFVGSIKEFFADIFSIKNIVSLGQIFNIGELFSDAVKTIKNFFAKLFNFEIPKEGIIGSLTRGIENLVIALSEIFNIDSIKNTLLSVIKSIPGLGSLIENKAEEIKNNATTATTAKEKDRQDLLISQLQKSGDLKTGFFSDKLDINNTDLIKNRPDRDLKLLLGSEKLSKDAKEEILSLLKQGMVPEAQFGGIVPPRPGGTLIRVAEAGSPELISPLNNLSEIFKKSFEQKEPIEAIKLLSRTIETSNMKDELQLNAAGIPSRTSGNQIIAPQTTITNNSTIVRQITPENRDVSFLALSILSGSQN